MGTEVSLSFSALRTQLENEKSNLFKIDENIKKIVQSSGRFTNDRFNSSGDYTRGGPRPGGRNSFPDAGKNEDLFGKRRHETKTVFSRLSARVHDSDGEDEGPGIKRTRMPSAVCRELPTRAAVLRAQGDDEQARTRNRRIFGSLLGTLQKFKQEEIGLQTKEEKKAQVERKIEEQARQQKEKEQKERKTLFAERDQRKATIKALEAKMGRVQEFEKWEASQKHLGNFILTKAKPHIYWLPKKMTEKATEKLNSSRKFHEKCMIKKRQELQEELVRIEQCCLRRGPGAKENDPNPPHEDKRPQRKDSETTDDHMGETNDDKGRKRDKFAMDDDDKEKDESDGEERHDITSDTQIEPKEEKETEENKAGTKVEQNEAMETIEEKNLTMDDVEEQTTTDTVEQTTTMDTVEQTTTMDTVEQTTTMDTVEQTTTMDTVEQTTTMDTVEQTTTMDTVEQTTIMDTVEQTTIMDTAEQTAITEGIEEQNATTDSTEEQKATTEPVEEQNATMETEEAEITNDTSPEKPPDVEINDVDLEKPYEDAKIDKNVIPFLESI